jgi:hypothetical protein
MAHIEMHHGHWSTAPAQLDDGLTDGKDDFHDDKLLLIDASGGL